MSPLPAVAIRGLIVIAAALCASVAIAAEPIRLTVAAPPGGGTDAVFRAVAREAATVLGESIAVLNLGGAGGSIAVSQLTRSPPDGRNLAGILAATVTTIPHSMKVPYKPDDYLPVIQISTAPYVICTKPAFRASNGRELIEEIKSHPDRYTYGTDGIGGGTHLATERILRAIGGRARDVPFKGAGETIVALLGGHIDLFVGSIPTVMPHVKAGNAKCLLVTSARRASSMPTVDALGDVGLAAEAMQLSRLLVAPIGTPPEMVGRLEAAFERAAATSAVQKFLADASEEHAVLKGAELRASLAKEYEDMRRIVRILGIKPPE